jgi:paraquat-inducible protein B
MSKQANKTIIGAFVLGAIALVVSGVLMFGSGKLLREIGTYVLYFEGSVKGLNIGSPVLFRGVKVGSVTDIMLQYNPEDLNVYIPVVIEVERDRFESVTDKKRKKAKVRELIDHGLRAQLQLQSMVTGQLMVNLDFYPDEPFIMVSREKARYPEIPAIPSDLQKITKTIEKLPLDKIFNKLSESLDGIEKIVNSPDLQGSIASLKKALDSADTLLVNINRKVEPLVANIEDTSDAARDAFAQAEKTLALEEGVPGELASSIKETLASIRNTLGEAEQSLASVQGVIDDDSPLAYELNKTLKDLSAAARSLRMLTDYLGRQPESLIQGKDRQKGVTK